MRNKQAIRNCGPLTVTGNFPATLTTLDPEAEMEERWVPVFVHESGHALMAVLQGINCDGIFYEMDSKKFCTLVEGPTGEPSNKDYLCRAAGTAAECLINRSHDAGAAAYDRKLFEVPGAPSYEGTVENARKILSDNKQKLQMLVTKLKDKGRGANYPLHLSPQTLNGKQYLPLLSKMELEKVA